MKPRNSPSKKILFLLGFAAINFYFLSIQAHSLAWESLGHPQKHSLNANLTFAQASTQSASPSPGQGAPRGTKKSGTRPNCVALQNPLTPLVLTTKQAEGRELHWSFTAKEHPTFWVYVPYKAESIISSKFSLRNQAGETIYETNLSLTGQPGIIHIALPSTAPHLESGEWYRWYLFVDVYCNDTTAAQQFSADAWVKRQELNASLRSKIEKMPPQQQAVLNARNGFLYDAFATLAKLRASEPIKEDWIAVLRAVGLEAIATEPIRDCCTPENQ